MGNLYIWPAPTSQYQVHISVKTQVSSFSSLTTTMSLPPEYQSALMWNLAAELRPMYGLQPEQTIIAKAKKTLNVIRNANTQVPRLNLPPSVTRANIYNIYGD